MPLGDPSQQATRGTPAFSAAQIQQLDAYVGSFGTGPPIPVFDLRKTNLSNGNDLFTVNCAPCHGVTGAGDAIGGPAFAPSLSQSSPLDVQEAVRVGPGQMPDFTSVLDPTQINDITRYVEYLHEQGDPGGANLGLIGPVPEGFVAWFLGAGVLVIITILFVGKPAHRSAAQPSNEEH
jgi:ubiquinol-cytochrome c reductase cytochrome c subunit